MIIVRENKTITKDTTEDLTKLDGSYYAIICSVQLVNEVEDPKLAQYYCSIYIPEVYGAYNQDAQNYPIVVIPHCQDSDDEGHKPEIGELCKVMFEDGNSCNSRLLYYVYISPMAKLLNANYIKYNILPRTTVDKVDDPEQIKKFTELGFLDIAYYITTGHKQSELTFQDFTPCVLGPEKDEDSGWWIFKTKGRSAAKNYFCKALSMPFLSFFTDDIYDTGIPINASELYCAKDALVRAFYNDRDKLISKVLDIYLTEKYNFVDTDIYSPRDIYLETKNLQGIDEYMQKIIIASLCYCTPNFASYLFPEIQDLPDELKRYFTIHFSTQDNHNYSEFLWDRYSNVNYNPDLVYPTLLYNIREYFENEYLNAIPVFMSGMSDIQDTKTKYAAVLCLTICPWLAYPMILYVSTVAFNAELNLSLKNNGKDPKDFRNYSTYLKSEEDFTQISMQLHNLLKVKYTDYRVFVSKFRDIAYKVFGDGLLYDYKSVDDINPWTHYEMDAKFNRLKDTINKFLENAV